MFGIDTVFIIFAVLAAASAAAGAAGVKYQHDAAKNAANYNAEVNKVNARTAAEQGLWDAEQTRSKNKKILDAQRATYSASGIDPDSGTALDVRADSAQAGEMDALIQIYTGQSSANASEARSRLNQMEAKASSRAGTIGAGASLLGGAASIAGNPRFYN